MFENFTAYRAELAADWILPLPVWPEKTPAIYKILEMRRTRRIGTEGRVRTRRRRCKRTLHGRRRNSLPLLLPRQLYTELGAKFCDGIVVQLRSIALLKHGQGRLLAADFICNNALGQPSFPPGVLELSAKLWT